MTSIIQPWAAALGLRHQGVLVSAIRGCDSVHRGDPSKLLVRMYRGTLLVPHCGDVRKSASFMIPFDGDEWYEACAPFFQSIDHYPNHWLLHWLHACEITGYKHSSFAVRTAYCHLYQTAVRKFHMYPEPETELDNRLNADEARFAQQQQEL